MSDDTWADDDVPILVVTVTATCPAAPAGASTLQVDEVHPMIVAGADPKFTTVAPERPEPEMVTGLPPVIEPVDGDRDEMAGGGVVVPTSTSPALSPARQNDDEAHATEISGETWLTCETVHVSAPPVGSVEATMSPATGLEPLPPTSTQSEIAGQDADRVSTPICVADQASSPPARVSEVATENS